MPINLVDNSLIHMIFYLYLQSSIGRLNIPIQGIFVSHEKVTEYSKSDPRIGCVTVTENEECKTKTKWIPCQPKGNQSKTSRNNSWWSRITCRNSLGDQPIRQSSQCWMQLIQTLSLCWMTETKFRENNTLSQIQVKCQEDQYNKLCNPQIKANNYHMSIHKRYGNGIMSWNTTGTKDTGWMINRPKNYWRSSS